MVGVRVRSVLAIAAVGALMIGCSSSGKSASSSSSSSSAGGGVTVPSNSGGTTVNVTLGDTKGTDGPMTLTPDPTSVKSGSVSFSVKNTGTVDHEMVVLKTDTAFDQLPIGTEEADKVDEATSVGEAGDPELKPGETRVITLDLQAGKYVFVCNIAKHYGLGMRAAFTVT